MKRLAVAALLVALASTTRGDDPPSKAPMGDNPGAEHKALMKMAGDYTTTTVMRIPNAPVQESKGSAHLSPQLEGRFLSERDEGEMMGQKYTSFKVYGFNNSAKKYEGLWVYTGSTAMMRLTGTSSDGGKTINFESTVDQGNGKMNFTIVMKHVDDDKFTVEMTAKSPDGNPGPSMLTTYTRQKRSD